MEKLTYEKPELIKHAQLKEVTLSSTGSGKKPNNN
ncbi:lasso RiPP family leader peptide-containing protein [Paenibacillus sp.]|nr:lasso RiPP family leader peptide-containing protein [Paenibacillus sp.]HZG58504.1 lasso RiPP family leader peptide-containing protein [Paenibacillus sp.]